MRLTTALRNFFTDGVIAIIVLAAVSAPAAISADGGPRDALSLSLAMDALTEAINVCLVKGYRVAAAIVDPDGVVKIEARGDGSPIHSQRFSFRKAYTIVSMGPMFGVDTGSALVAQLRDYPAGLANIQGGATDLLFLAGSVLIESDGVAIGAIGVSGAPLSSEDEACAQAGLAKVRSRLEPGAAKN